MAVLRSECDRARLMARLSARRWFCAIRRSVAVVSVGSLRRVCGVPRRATSRAIIQYFLPVDGLAAARVEKQHVFGKVSS
jgi:hypothetical protein